MNRMIGVIARYADESADGREANLERQREICRQIVCAGDIPIAPALFVSTFLDDSIPAQRTLGLEISGYMLGLCREARVYGEVSEGMLSDIAAAEAARVPCFRVED